MFQHYTHPHVLNIVLHILAGSAGILAGLVALVTSKGGRAHRRAGYTFIFAYAGVFVTAVLGVAVFEFRSFLTVATIASAYSVFSGYRALKLRGQRPQAVDRVGAAAGLAAPLLFLGLMHFTHKPWSPALTWSVLGVLIAMSAYDLLRILLPLEWLRRVWVQEHLLKMINALNALVSTFAATVFPQYQPWAALIPALVGTGVAIGFVVAGPRAWRPSSRRPGLKPTLT